jgi:desulfoferrodoxin (superoxide reductase-like protein)
MNRTILKSRVDADGVLRVNLPLGTEEADQEVQVTVEPVPAKKPMTQEEYAAWVESMAGTWQGEFERPEQGEIHERDHWQIP